MGVHMNRGMRFAFVAAALEGALSLAGSIGQSGHDGGIIRWLAARCPKVW
jgi:rhodanese-related sulfurtransferase